MEWLLKIVEGPMKGAEIALVGGTRVKLGAGDACDIVIADQSVPAVACELDVSESAVTLVGTDGEAKELAPFVLSTFGATAFAIGPAEGAWEELKRPEPAKAEPADDAGSEPPPRTDIGRNVGSAGQPPRGEGVSGTETARPRRVGLVVAVILLTVTVLAVLAWFFWPRLAVRQETVPASPSVSVPTLAEIASTHGLSLVGDSGRPVLLKGNVKRRTERLAIRALALSADPTVRFDLTDDETLQSSANELLFVVTEGRLTASAASNRVVTLAGYVPNAAALERAVRALSSDVPGIGSLVTSSVQVGGVPPKSADAPLAAASGAPRPAGAARSRSAGRDYPIAGILAKPYPCVVMRGGLRLVEGALIGNAVIEKIEVDRLTLRDGKTSVVWRP